ncbi:hypothetical protein AB4084_09380, partial [Lysobacter sp. 2RAB21]
MPDERLVALCTNSVGAEAPPTKDLAADAVAGIIVARAIAEAITHTPHATDSMIAAPPEFAPIPARERLLALDALRGIALLGILLSNVASFAGPLAELSEGIDPTLSGSDYGLSAFVYVAIRNKFWTLFALLFGMGFAVMLERARDAGRGFGAIYLRRSIGLLAIGLI